VGLAVLLQQQRVSINLCGAQQSANGRPNLFPQRIDKCAANIGLCRIRRRLRNKSVGLAQTLLSFA